MVQKHRNQSNLCLLAAAASFALAIVFCSSNCQALSAPSKPVIPNPLGGIFKDTTTTNNNNNNNNIRIQLFDPTKESESMLQNLQDCRRTAFDPNKQNWMNSERDFVTAKKVTDGLNLCVIAFDTNTQNIVGSADLTPSKKGTSNVVTNVFVTPNQRGKGIGKLLMVEGIEQILAKELPSKNLKTSAAAAADAADAADASSEKAKAKGNNQEATISLDVYTQNKAAFELYQKLGYEPSSAIHSGTMAMAKTLGANFVVSMSKTVPV